MYNLSSVQNPGVRTNVIDGFGGSDCFRLNLFLVPLGSRKKFSAESCYMQKNFSKKNSHRFLNLTSVFMQDQKYSSEFNIMINSRKDLKMKIFINISKEFNEFLEKPQHGDG